MSLPVLRDGDALSGAPCVVPAHLRYCDECGCLRRDGDGWSVLRRHGHPHHVCQRHPERAP